MPGDVHVWSVPNFVSQSDGLVVRTSTTVMRGPEMNFKLSLVDFGTNLISSLSVFAFPELNGVSIICSDPSSEMIQNSTANILGKNNTFFTIFYVSVYVNYVHLL